MSTHFIATPSWSAASFGDIRAHRSPPNGAQRRRLSDDALLVHIKASMRPDPWQLRLAAHLARAAGTRYPGE